VVAIMDDAHAIRELVQVWMQASKAGDTAKVLSLLTDDVVFMVPGQEPFGKDAFAKMAAQQQPGQMEIEGTAETVEVQVMGDWAYMRNRLEVKVTPKGGQTITRSGYTLTFLRKETGQWRLARDANLLTLKNS
jgi:uncharacterized protein (TIGR02246 family)